MKQMILSAMRQRWSCFLSARRAIREDLP
jgi:hypothetical protein